MNEAERRILDLLEKLNNNTATNDELSELDRWYDSFENDEKLTTGFSKEKLKESGDEMLRHIFKEIGVQRNPSGPKIFWRRGSIAILASILFFSTLFIFKIISHKAAQNSEKLDVMPGKNAAVLTLPNGKRINLNSAPVGTIYTDKGIAIIKKSNGIILYQALTKGSSFATGLNTLSTPAGGQFEVILSDGSKVWLNAMSSLSFPTLFSDKKRPVKLSGEAYFEIAKNKAKPFVVGTATEHVEVMGTHFNINAYPDEGSQRTTLLEGSVRVISNKKNLQAIIKPGQQAIGDYEQLIVRAVDPDDAIGWKEGFFVFDHTELHDLMRQLSRWYNLDIVYQGKTKPRAFSGSIDRNYTLVQTLNVLKVSRVNFKIEKPNGDLGRSKLILTP